MQDTKRGWEGLWSTKQRCKRREHSSRNRRGRRAWITLLTRESDIHHK